MSLSLAPPFLIREGETMAWSPDSWRNCEARQQPKYEEPAAVAAVERTLACRPPLIDPGEADALKAAIAEAQAGRAFLLQGGDCAESFAAFSADYVHSTADLLERMAESIEHGSGLPVFRVGRIAGQFAKPRTAALERRGAVALPAYRGDAVNGLAFDPAERRAEPSRMLRAYDQAASTLAMLRTRPTPVYASHEALLLPYEQALVRTDPLTGRSHATSGHMVWIGDRTRFPGSAHIEFARGLANPLGIKCGPTLDADNLLRLLDQLDPAGERGRITLIGRMGASEIERTLPPLLRAIRRERRPVLWACDPMHGNTIRSAGGAKDRPLSRILAETRTFFALAAAEGAAGGLHLEMTGEAVSECSGAHPSAANPASHHSQCDPRLNPAQAMQVAALVAEALAGAGHSAPLRRALA